MRITLIGGARPNFMKLAAIINAIESDSIAKEIIRYRLVHTGQHYDSKMSNTFFEELNIPAPDVNLDCRGGTHAEQTAAIMIAFEKDLVVNPTDLVVVVGDVNSTLACSIVAKKMGTKVAHVEAGIRSYDLSMPEEINRIVTDSICDYFFTTTQTASNNLLSLGVAKERIFFVGNVMIDTLLANKARFFKPTFFDPLSLQPKGYLVMTLHRPSNVDEPDRLASILWEVVTCCKGVPIIFPIHPRTKKALEASGFSNPGVLVVDSQGYLQFNYLVSHSAGVITDSGGVTEETTVLNIPCITIRNSTERPETVELGTNELIGDDIKAIGPYIDILLSGNWKTGEIPPLWDGKSSVRIVNHLIDIV